MKVVITPEAAGELGDIWDWNAKDRGIRHADSYLDFLQKSIAGLNTNHIRGKSVETRPDLRYIQIRRRNRGHGHIAVYLIEGDEVLVVHVFHTAQDWQAKLAEEQS